MSAEADAMQVEAVARQVGAGSAAGLYELFSGDLDMSLCPQANVLESCVWDLIS